MTPKRRKLTKNAKENGKKNGARPRRSFRLSIPNRKLICGDIYVCGMGECGQLGLGEKILEQKQPTLNPALNTVVDICAGGMHTICLSVDGEVFTFGCNDEGALGRIMGESESEFLANQVVLPGDAVKISAGDSHSACLLADGRVFAWGTFRNSNGSMGLTIGGIQRKPFEIMNGIKCCDIASGANHLVILTCASKAYTIGCGDQGQLGRVTERVVSGTSRNSFEILLKPTLVKPRLSKHICAIWASTYCTFLRETGTKIIWAFGLNNYNQIAIDRTEDIIYFPKQSNFENVLKICGGQHHTLVLTQNNKCYIIGRRDYGILGLGNIANHVVEPTLVHTLKDEIIVDISCGEMQSFAINVIGKIYAWGMGVNFQLGTGSSNDSLEPMPIKTEEINGKILNVKSGGQHTIFLAGKAFNCLDTFKRKEMGDVNN